MKKVIALFLVFFMAEAEAKMIETKTAILAGGCFWCIEKDFEHVKGVIDVQSGYTGGHVKDPTYDHVSSGGTGHKEVVQIEYDPTVVTYEKILEIFWHSIDPLDDQGQFCDKGDQYKSAIYYATEEEKVFAEKTKDAVAKELGEDVATEIIAASTFYPAEEYHQGYYKKNPIRYRFYRGNCGRDKRVKEIWGDQAHRGIDY